MLALGVLLVAKTALVVLAGRATSRLLDRGPASSRHTVWVTVFAVILLLPLASVVVDDVPVPVTGLPTDATPMGHRAASSAPPRQTAPAPPSVEPHRAPPVGVPWGGIAACVYLAGVCLALIPFAVGSVRARRILRRATPARTHRLWSEALDGFERPWTGTVVVSTDVRVPATFGFLRPVIVLPDDVAAWSATERRDAIVHELAHIARSDWAYQVLAVVACALHWFNPLVWAAGRQLRLEAERACDERVLQLGTKPEDYADQLVNLARSASANTLGATIAMSRDSCLAQRITTILKYRRMTMRTNVMLTVCGVLFAASTLLLAPLRPVTAADYVSARRAANLPPLSTAVVKGFVDDVAKQIADGADVNERVAGRGTPLILAATYGHLEIATLLLDAGADVNRRETRSPRDLMRTPLTAAARNGHLEIAELLLDNGARVDAAPTGDATALMEAADNDHEGIVALLLDRGADVNLAIDGDGNAIIAAARGGNVDIAIRIVAAGANVNDGVPGDGNALIMAVRAGDRAMVEYLLSQGADPTAYVPGDETALLAAAERGDEALVRMLIDAK